MESVVQLDCLFRDISDLSYLGEIIREDSMENIQHEKHMKQNLLEKVLPFRLMQ